MVSSVSMGTGSANAAVGPEAAAKSNAMTTILARWLMNSHLPRWSVSGHVLPRRVIISPSRRLLKQQPLRVVVLRVALHRLAEQRERPRRRQAAARRAHDELLPQQVRLD